MRVDFYQLSHDPVEVAVAKLAASAMAAGQRMLVVAQDGALMKRIDDGLWAHQRAFLAHGAAGAGDEDRQPILLSREVVPANGAKFLVIADGQWREEAQGFERTFFVFDEPTVHAPRQQWRQLGQDEGIERKFWKQEDGKWIMAA